MKHYIYTFLFLLVSQVALSQIQPTIVKENTYTVTGVETLTASHSITLKPDTWIKSGSTFIAQIAENTTATDPYTSFSFSNENYVFKRSFYAPMTSFDVATAKEGDVTEQITYFDGLGRPMQGIGIKASPNDKKDIIRHIDYDDYGRQDKDWLSYHELSGVVGTYRGDKAVATQSYYQTNYADDFAGVTLPADINAYSEKDFEASPLSRVMKQGAPGKDWKLGANHGIAFNYQSNIADEVRFYHVSLVRSGSNGVYTFTPTLTGGTIFYAANELYKTITKDENHDGTTSKNHSTEEFKDKQGRIVLKRTYTNVASISTAHDTYYVYDDFGNLTYVLPPKSEPNTALPDATKLSELCYQYKYDDRNRLVEKKIPGKDWEYMVYNNLDQLVLTQEVLQRPNKQWLFTKYDVFGRVTYTGIYTHGTVVTREQMAIVLKTYYTTNTSEDLFEEKVVTEGSYHYYSNAAFPNTGLEVLTINYYDDYSFNKDGLSLPSTGDGQAIINYNDANKHLTGGLVTGSKIKVLTTNDWITTLTGYDVKGRPVYTVSKNNYLSTTDIAISKLDFVGKVDKTTITHTKTGQTAITTQDAFVYDHEGRLLRQKQTINNLDQETIVDNTYDNLGQLESKGVGGKSSNTNRLQDVDYTYNVRGWLKGINNTGGSNSAITLGVNDLFGFQINYNIPSAGGTALFNGNISQTLWKSTSVNNTGNPVANKYSYSYDALNRITAATGNMSNYNLNSVAYDKNGNITSLVRRGHTNSGATTFGVMDDLTYSYDSGNKLMKVADAASIDPYGFKDDAVNTSPDGVNDYTYDVNGNMLTDANKGITTNITYNHLNLPTSVTLNGGNISYIYDATGVKLKKIVSTGSTATEYAGNYVYENGSLKFFNHAEGYVSAELVSGSVQYSYVYQYKDHLGNVRLSYEDIDGNGSIAAATEILEENNYYPFGLKHKGYNTNVSANINSVAKRFKYNGVEYEDALGLNLYEMDVRSYDPAIARFIGIDPVTHHSNSTYTAFDNNPVIFADPSGADSETLFKSKALGSHWSDAYRSGNEEEDEGEPNDWILKDGKYVWDEDVTEEGDKDLPTDAEYVGANLSDVKSHYEKNNSFLFKLFESGYLSFTDINSYYNAKVPLVIEEMFNKHKWYYNLKMNGDNRAEGGYSKIVKSNSLKRILNGHAQSINGSISLDGVEYGYTAYLGKANSTSLNLMGYFDIHPQKDWTLAVGNTGATLKGKYFYLSNPVIGASFPVLSVHFKNHDAAASWFDKYK